MYTTDALLDIHERTHRSIAKVMAHVATLPADELNRPLEGFSYPTLASQLHHVIGAERYWMQVMLGTIQLDDDASEHETIEALQATREQVAAGTRAYIGGLTDAQASAPTSVTQWNGKTIDVVPAHVVLRTQTHAYQHQGEIATMLRQLGHGFPSMLDFPLG